MQGTTIFDQATLTVEAELESPALTAQIVRFDIPAPTAAVLCDEHAYHINMCLTPRPMDAKAAYREHWGPHRLDRLGDIFLIPPGEKNMSGPTGRPKNMSSLE